MRLLLPLAALAMVSACSKPAPAPEATATADVAAATPVALPTVGPNARTTLNYAGTYQQVGADGKVTSLKLNKDDTYEWTDATGKVTKGSFSWYKDGSRILLDAGAGKAVYAIADGAVYKLADKDAPVDALTADQMWKRGAF
ncbi:hypothetical protein ACFO0A_03710 [Novosphingobium tardum]|jgi:hypothetical protein|uniref:Uncharacterized protein n=1 Tax=Novosphingobium tardum TaxID=1538021 RepID=A0ABV8RLH7_9SPHN